MIGPEMRSALLAHLDDLGYIGIDVMPIFGYSDSEPPFILWNEFDYPPQDERPFILSGSVVFYIYATLVTDIRDLTYHVERFFNVDLNPNVVNAKISTTSNYRIIHIKYAGGNMFPPLEREGYISKSMAFNVDYVYANNTE